MPICDMHIHTRLSSDADQREDNCVLTYCKNAQKAGIKYLAFTEHRDIITGDDGKINADLYESERQCCKAKKEFGSFPEVLFGVELAHAHTHKKEAEEILSAQSFDFVLGSLHVLSDDTDFYRMDFSEYTDAELRNKFSDYLSELCDIAENCDFDSLAHASYPLRYFRRSGRRNAIELSDYYKDYDRIFGALIERGKALEINCKSFLESGYNAPVPEYELIDRYIYIGGKLFTLGSDTHDCNDVGIGIGEAQKYLKSKNVDRLCAFRGRKMFFIPNDTE